MKRPTPTEKITYLQTFHNKNTGCWKYRMFWEVIVPTKTRKKSLINMGPEMHTFWEVHLSIVADDIWLRVRLRERQGKHRGNKYCLVTVVAERQRDALLWTDVTLSISCNKCHEWTSGWSSPMKECRATGRRKYAFPDPCVIFFFMFWYVLPPLTMVVTLCF